MFWDRKNTDIDTLFVLQIFVGLVDIIQDWLLKLYYTYWCQDDIRSSDLMIFNLMYVKDK